MVFLCYQVYIHAMTILLVMHTPSQDSKLPTLLNGEATGSHSADDRLSFVHVFDVLATIHADSDAPIASKLTVHTGHNNNLTVQPKTVDQVLLHYKLIGPAAQLSLSMGTYKYNKQGPAY